MMSPAPWRVYDEATEATVMDATNRPVLHHCAFEDAKALVQAVNMHARLVLALQRVCDELRIADHRGVPLGVIHACLDARALLANLDPERRVP